MLLYEITIGELHENGGEEVKAATGLSTKTVYVFVAVHEPRNVVAVIV